MAERLGTWAFVVLEESGEVQVDWAVIDTDGQEFTGRVPGGLYAGILAAFDAVELVCPFVADPDLVNLLELPEGP